MKNTPTSAPEGMLGEIQKLAPKELRDRVTQMTGADLDSVMKMAEAAKQIPDAFRESGVAEEIERRMEQLGVQDSVRAKWQQLKAQVGDVTQKTGDVAEKKFMEQLVQKGGAWALIGTVGISVLSWFGFKHAKALKQSINEKGYLRTAIDGAKEHPIFAAFIAALGIKATYEVAEYFHDNREAVEKHIAEESKKLGIPPEQVAVSLADKLRVIVSKGTDVGVLATVKAFAFVTGGEYDEETGVVTLPYSQMRPPVIVAWQAGVRRRMKFPLPVVEKRLEAILKQTDLVTKESRNIAGHKKVLAERAINLMKKGTAPGVATAEGLELERILNTLSDDLNLTKQQALDEVRYKPGDAEQKLRVLEAEMERIHKTEIADFKTTKDGVNQKLYEAESALSSGKYVGSAESIKKNAITDAEDTMKRYRDDLVAKKLPLAEQITDVMNQIAENEGHMKHQLDNHAVTGKGAILEKATTTVEKAGLNLRKLPGGKLAIGAVMGYSFLPLAMEGVAGLQSGAEGAAAQRAFTLDATEAGAGFIPLVGEALDFRSAIMGTDLNGRELDTWSRVTAGTMGTLGAASIGLGFFTGGLSIVAFRGMRGVMATRKAIKVAKLMDKGITVSRVTDKSIGAIKAGQKSADVLDDMLALSKTEQKLHKAKNFVQNAQRTMQLVTYSQLGYQVASGLTTLVGSAQDIVGTVQKKALEGIDTAEQFVTGNTTAA